MSCGNVMSVNDTHVTYTNSLISHTIVDDNFPSVVFGSQWGEHEIEWDCAYPINYLSSLTSSYADDQFQYFQVRRLIIDHTLSGTGFGIFPIAMFLYRDENYDVIHPNPPALGMDQTLYLGISLIEGPMDAVIQVRECWATPTNNSEDQFTYGLIKNNCPALEAEHVQIDNAPLQRHFRWSSPVFRFTTSSRVYVHCYVSICFTNMQQCSKSDCQQRFRRRRSIDDVSKEQWNEEALLSVGPIFLDKDVENVNSNIFFDDVLKNNDADHYHDRDRAMDPPFAIDIPFVVIPIRLPFLVLIYVTIWGVPADRCDCEVSE
uniref:ZP domain-containing protein n=1 Tax=Ciona savignyi TaxID=51511 RepID=H2YZN4_CIOSA